MGYSQCSSRGSWGVAYRRGFLESGTQSCGRWGGGGRALLQVEGTAGHGFGGWQ